MGYGSSGLHKNCAGELSIFRGGADRALWAQTAQSNVLHSHHSECGGGFKNLRSMVSVRDVFAATFSELRPDGLQRGRRIFASSDSPRQPPSIDVSL